MKKLKLVALSLSMLCPMILLSQDGPFGYYNDALLFSRTTFGGTARIQAIGGAQVSLGGDQSVAGSNPAGLGFFNRSTVVFTPSLNFHNSDSDFLGDETTSFRTNFNFSQLGVVLNYSKPATSSTGFRGGSFAISINRTNNFNNDVEYVGFNNDNSIVDSFLESAGTTDPDQLGGFEAIAYDHFLIDLADFDSDLDYTLDNNVIVPFDGDGTFEGYGSPFGRFAGSLPRQTENIETKGGQNQINFSWGGNFSDRFYFGGGLGIATINYRRERTYIEDAFALETIDDDGNTVFVDDDLINSIQISDVLDVSGTGVNATLGVIVRPVDFLTVGASYVTPTFYAVSEESFFTFITDWNSAYSYGLPDDTVSLGQIITDSDIIVSDYGLRTPAKFNLGTTFFLGKYGFISADAEYVDYSSARLRSSDFREQNDNDLISDLYRDVINIRFGGEFRLNQARFRAGYARMADPFEDSEINRAITDLTFGAGFRTRDYFIDLAIINRSSKDLLSPYFVENGQPVADIKNSTTSALVTVGFTF